MSGQDICTVIDRGEEVCFDIFFYTPFHIL